MLEDKTFAILKTSPGSYVLGAKEEKTASSMCVCGGAGKVAFTSDRRALLSGEALIQSHDPQAVHAGKHRGQANKALCTHEDLIV